MPTSIRGSWFGLLVLTIAVKSFAADFNPVDNYYRSGFDFSICANGLVEDAEQCDDGNLDASDGCSSDCRIETGVICNGSPSICSALLAESEPNDSLAAADAASVGFSSSATMLGTISPLADLDYFRVLVTNSFDVVRFESFAPIQGACTGGVTTTLRLRNEAGVQLVADSLSGISGCAVIVFGMTPATYYIQIEETGNNATIASYALQATYLSDLGVESEAPGMVGVNDMAATAESVLLGTRDGVVYGDHSVSSDVDYYAITLPAGAAVRAETIEGNRLVATCESNAIDSFITLYAANGTTQLAFDDDNGRGFCSLIDGTGGTPLHPGARNTTGTAQTWFLAVRASSAAGPDTMFTYRLAISIR